MIRKVDKKNRFVSLFDPKTGFYVRSGVMDENGKDTERSIAGACVSVFVLESGSFDFSGGKESWRLLCNRKSDDAFLPADRSFD